MVAGRFKAVIAQFSNRWAQASHDGEIHPGDMNDAANQAITAASGNVLSAPAAPATQGGAFSLAIA